MASPGSPATRLVRYHGYRLRVPASWPVYRLGADPRTCVRFDRHAVFLGAPGADQLCPAGPAGRTEAILVAPLSASRRAALPASATGPGQATQLRLVDTAARVVVIATWHHDPQTIRRALQLSSLRAAIRAAAQRPEPEVAYAIGTEHALTRSRPLAHAASPGGGSVTTPPPTPSAPGEVYTGAGFDACSTPSTSEMTAWGSSPYRTIGVYIGGTNMACSQSNLTATWVAQESAAGWHLIPIYVGLQAPSNSCGCAAMSSAPATAAAEGTAAAQNAVTDAQAIGLGAGNPLYLDMEAYSRTSANTDSVLAFESAWTAQLHAEGYGSGIYSSSNSGISDLVSQYGTTYAEPNEIWIASWNGQQNTSDPNVPAADWSNHQRVHQYSGAHDETYQGVRINIDGDWVDAPTAAAGTGPGVGPTPAPAPSLAIKAGLDGSVSLTPSWPYEQGITAWQAIGGTSPASLTWAAPAVPAGGALPIVAYDSFPYWAVQALNGAGQVIGTSAPVAEPAHLALFGSSVFVPRQGLGGVPVACYAIAPCTLTTAVYAGRRRIAITGRERLGAGAGLVYFKLSPADHTRLQQATQHRLPVTVSVSDGAGHSATRPVDLNGFTTVDPSPLRRAARSAGLRFIGLTEFVSHGWVGGVLATCNASAPCDTTTTLVAGRQTIARSVPQLLGVGEVGYLFFKLTPYGHRLLMHAPGNQLGTYATLNSGNAFARAHVVLVAFQ
ncbi:MAG: DUF1906 domain-containing protein [Solirubrobacteraceae bacterium]